MTVLGMTFSRFINAVALRHEQVSQAMFPQFDLASVTNGVHAGRGLAPASVGSSTPTSPAGGGDNAGLHYAIGIPLEEIAPAHADAKHVLVDEVRPRTGVDPRS